MTLREFIRTLEELSEGGKNDNLEVGVMISDEDYCCVEQVHIGTCYPGDDIDIMNLQHPTTCLMIEI